MSIAILQDAMTLCALQAEIKFLRETNTTTCEILFEYLRQLETYDTADFNVLIEEITDIIKASMPELLAFSSYSAYLNSIKHIHQQKQ